MFQRTSREIEGMYISWVYLHKYIILILENEVKENNLMKLRHGILYTKYIIMFCIKIRNFK